MGYSDYKRRKKEEEEKSGKKSNQTSSRNYSSFSQYKDAQKFGIDTFESDLTNLGTTIGNIYNGWHDAETMKKTRTSVEDMQRRVNMYQDYQKKYGGTDLSQLASGYQSVLDDWDTLSSTYGHYQNADAFNTARTQSLMEEKFHKKNKDNSYIPLTYDEVQNNLKQYKKGSDEYNYLSEYMGYSDLKDFDKAISNTVDGDYKERLQAERNKFALDNTSSVYDDIMNAEDFEEKSQYKEVKYDGLWDRIVNEGKDVYEYVNIIHSYPEEMRSVIKSDKFGVAGIGSLPAGIENMTEDEFKTYFYLSSDGNYDKGLEYLKDMEVELSKRGQIEDNKRSTEWLESGNAVDRKLKQGVMSALSVPAGLMGKIEGFVDDATNMITGDTINPYNSSHSMMNSASNIQKTTSENIEEYTVKNDWVGTDLPIVGNVWSSAYNDAISIGENALGTLTFGPGYSKVAAAGAFTSRAKELKEEGASDDQIRNGAIASAVFEYLGEKSGLDNLFKINNVDSFGKLLKNIPGQMFAELGEEALTEFLNITGDAINRGVMSDIYVEYQNYLDRGFSKEEALKNTAADFGVQIAKAGISGAISGAVMGGGYGAIQYHDNAKTGQKIRDNSAVNDLKDLAGGLNNDAYADYLKLIDEDKISNAQLGNLYTEVSGEVSKNLNHEKANVQMRPMAERAYELGDGKNAGMVASAVTKHLNGEKLSAEEKAMLKTDTAKTILEDVKRGDIKVKATDSLNKAIDDMSKTKNIMNRSVDEVARKKRVEDLNKGNETVVNGESANLEGIKIEDGSTIVLTSQGKAKAEDMTFSSSDAELLSYAEIMGAERGNLFISQYDGKMDVSDYQKSFNLAYAYGEAGIGADNVLANKGVLTETQASAIYKSAVMSKANARQTAIDEITKKYNNLTVKKGAFDDSIIDYDGTSTDGSKVNWNTLTSKQRGAVTFAKAFSQATGVNIRFVKSNVVDGKHRGKNGSYDPNTNTIEIDVYAGRIDVESATDAIIPTISHEVTHWMKAKSPRAFAKLQEKVMNTFAMDDGMSMDDRIDAEIDRLNMAHPEKNATEEDAIDEIMARACEDMLSNSEKTRELLDGLTEAEKKSFVSKVKETFDNLIKWVNELLGQYKSESKEAEFLRGYENALKEAQKLWDEAFAEAVKTNQALQMEGKTAEKVINEALEKIGLHYDAKTESVAPQMSERTWSESDYVVNREKAVENLAKALNISKRKAEKYVDSINSVARLIADDRARLDYDPNMDDSASVLKPNSDYKWSVDMSTLCAKRLLFTGTFDAIQKALPNTAMDSEDIVKLRQMMMDKGYQVACGICYVESTRREIGTITQDFIERYKMSQKTGNPITRVNSGGKVVELKKTKDQLKTTVDKTTDRFYADKNYTPTLAELNTTDIDLVKRDHPLVYEAYLNYMNARGQSKPKLLETRAEYKGEIAKMFARKKNGDLNSSTESMNASGGLRLQSFSDFEVAHLIDMMQVVMDMSSCGLMSQAYTKVPEFAEVFGNTGVKINLSLIAKGSGLDENGNLIFDDVEGIDHKKAFELRNKFSKNVGTILVGKNDAHIRKAMSDPRIDYIIPFHKSSWREDLYDALGLTGYADYTKTQHEKARDGRTISDFKPSEYWDYSKTGNENAAEYLRRCEEDNRDPKFPQFAYNEDGSVSDGYWKLLTDFKMYDNDGVGSPQTAVMPEFDMDAANRIMREYEGGHRSFPVAKDIVDSFVKDYKENHPKTQYADRIDELAIDKIRDIIKEKPYIKEENPYVEEALADLIREGRKIHERILGNDGETWLHKDSNRTLSNRYSDREQQKTIALGIAEAIATDGRASLMYRKLSASEPKRIEELATHSMVLRDPRFETFRQIYVKNGRVVATVATSSMAADSSTITTRKDFDELKDIRRRIKNLGADSLYVMHNHPSGNPNPSETDKGLTDWLKQNVSEFKGHLVIDHNKYTYMTDSSNIITGTTNKKKSGSVDFKKKIIDHPLLYNKVSTIRQLANASVDLVHDKDYSTVIYVDAHGEVRAVQEIMNPFMHSNEFLNYVANRKRDYGCAIAYLVTEDLDVSNSNMVRDGVTRRILFDVYNTKQSKSAVRDEKITHDNQYDAHGKTNVNGKRAREETINYSDREQTITSEDTSLNQTPATFTNYAFKSTDRIIDYGGGRYDTAKRAMEATYKGIKFEVVDAFNRTPEHNNRIFEEYSKNKANVLTVNNVLNVINSVPIIKDVIKESKKYLADDGICYIAIYEGNRTGNGAETTKGYQNNQPAAWYVPFVEKYYKNVRRQGSFIIASDSDLKGKTSKIDAETKARLKENTDALKKENLDMKHSKYADRTMTRSEANQLARQIVASYKENIEKKAKIESITQNALVLNKWMLKNSKEEHVPEAMKPVVAHLLKAIDFSSKRLLGMRGGQDIGKPTQTDISLAQALADVRQMMSKGEVDGEILYELYGADLDADMDDLVKSVNLYMRTVGDNEYVLNKMTLDELHKFDKIVGAMKSSVTKMNRFHVVNTKRGIAYTAQQDMVSMAELGQIKLPKSKLMKGVNQMLNWGNINPYFAFKRFGEGGKKVFEALQDGWDTFAFNVKKIIDFAEDTYSSEDVKAWSEEVKTFQGIGAEIQMTIPQIMSLYCLQKREQAKGHILGGGIRVADIETKNGVISQSEGAVISETLLKQIIGSLTKEQIAVADALQTFMNEDCAEWGNEISMKRFGYKAFGEKNYFPIKSDENVTGDGEVKEKEKSLYRLLNMSFTKALTQNANNRIIVDNIFDVFAQHTSEMAKYNALALPVLDAVRWFNYKEKGEKEQNRFKTYSVKQAMEKAFGKDAKSYVNTFLEDINGADNVGRDHLAKGFFSNAKIASVGFNLKVAALQPTSYLRASAIIDPKYLAKATNPSKVKHGIEMAEKWCGMALWKSLGFYDTNIQRGVADLIKHEQTWKDKVTEASMKGAEKMDKITWGCLWNACEEEVKATRKDLVVGSDEYYTTVGKRLREVIYATQVVDSTMTRSQMMRSPDTWDKVLTNFASEPTLAYNMLMDVFYDWKLTERKRGKSEAFKQHKGKMVRVAMAYTMTNLATSLLETAFQAYRDDDDEEEEFSEYVIAFLENFGSNMGITTKIPYVKDLISILQGFTSSRTDTQWMQNLTYAFKDWMKIFNGDGNVYKAVYRTISTASQLSGIAIGNAMRDLVAFWNLTIGNIYPSLKLNK